MIRGMIFDLNGTVIDILTDEGNSDVYRVLANFLDYQGIETAPDELKELFFRINKRQRRSSAEEYPEFDVVALFREIIEEYIPEAALQSLSKAHRKELPQLLARLFRAASRFKLQLYPGVTEVLDELRSCYALTALSDGQSIWALPELRAVGLADYFQNVLISSDLGFRKPDVRMFRMMLDEMKMTPDEVIFVGNDMFRDIFGAHRVGMKTVFFKSNQGEQRYMGAEPDYIIYDFRELPEAVRFLTKR